MDIWIDAALKDPVGTILLLIAVYCGYYILWHYGDDDLIK